MRRLLYFSFLILSFNTNAQKSLDTRIIVKVSDTINLYEKVRIAFVEEDFMVKDNGKRDTLMTYPNNTVSTTYIYAFASIDNNQVEIWGFMGDTYINLMGYTVNPGKKNFRKIFYYKRDKYWNKLLAVAKRLNGELSYGKEESTK